MPAVTLRICYNNVRKQRPRVRGGKQDEQMETMIEIRLSNGDTAEAEGPESAVVAARTMMDDAADSGFASRLLTASFYVGGKLVIEKVRRAELPSLVGAFADDREVCRDCGKPFAAYTVEVEPLGSGETVEADRCRGCVAEALGEAVAA